MNKSTKTALTILISIILASVLIWWAMRDLDIDRTWESVRHANYWWISASVILGMLAYCLRSERWRMLLAPMDHKPKSSHAFYAVCMNYFWNLVIPRSGEVARCTSLYALDKTPVDKSFGTVISERVIDMICLMFMGVLTIVFNFDVFVNLLREIKIARTTNPSEPSSNVGLYIFGSVALLIGILIFIFWKSLKKLPLYSKITTFIFGLKQGLKTIFQLKEKWKFIILTILIWIFYYLMTYLVVFALPETAHLSPAIGIYLLLVGGIGMVIPASGGIGAYHSALGIGFLAIGLSKEIGVTFAFLVHTPHTLIALILGLISLVMMSLEKSKSIRNYK
ncbi:flippase-like domain-containing protein [Flavobacteriaceae bacterium Ap0902]|nr:flippase-like domain-containing protein [Flavobacteriaceae bacterium Ap0902]